MQVLWLTRTSGRNCRIRATLVHSNVSPTPPVRLFSEMNQMTGTMEKSSTLLCKSVVQYNPKYPGRYQNDSPDLSCHLFSSFGVSTDAFDNGLARLVSAKIHSAGCGTNARTTSQKNGQPGDDLLLLRCNRVLRLFYKSEMRTKIAVHFLERYGRYSYFDRCRSKTPAVDVGNRYRSDQTQKGQRRS